jgi:predicted SAM-dependent methyltransferase
MPSETSICRHITAPYCQGNGVDLGSGGDPVVPWSIQVDLPEDAFVSYGHVHDVGVPIQWRGSATDLPFKDATLDFVYSSHLLEDFKDWVPVLREWLRVLKLGGHLIIMVPDHAAFRAAVAAGQGDNLSHQHESFPGELTEILKHDVEVLMDRVEPEGSYNIIFVGRKK